MRPSGKGLYAAGWINAGVHEPHPQYTSSWCDAVTVLFYQSWGDNLLRVLHWVEGCLGALCIILQLCNSKSGDSAHHPPPERVAVCTQCGLISKLATALLSLKYSHFFSLLKMPLKLCCFGFRLFFKKIYFIYLFLAVLGLHCCARAFSNCGERGLLFVAVCRLLILVASLVEEHGL